MRIEKPCQKFNLVVYYEKGVRLAKPVFHENVYVYSSDNYTYASDVVKFDKNDEDGDPIVEMLWKVIDTSFKYNGIHISGLEMCHDKKSRTTFFYQNWLVTNLTREELEKENWYGY